MSASSKYLVTGSYRTALRTEAAGTEPPRAGAFLQQQASNELPCTVRRWRVCPLGEKQTG